MGNCASAAIHKLIKENDQLRRSLDRASEGYLVSEKGMRMIACKVSDARIQGRTEALEWIAKLPAKWREEAHVHSIHITWSEAADAYADELESRIDEFASF